MEKINNISAVRREGGKFYSPKRDIKVFFIPAVKVALTMACSMAEDEATRKHLAEIGVSCGTLFNDALACHKKNVVLVQKGFYDKVKAYPRAWGLFASSLAMVFMTRFISGARESTDFQEPTEEEFRRALVTVSTVVTLPEELQKKVETALMLSGQWIGSKVIELPALFDLQEDCEELVKEDGKQS